ncbi:hypothetical protein [Sutterella sp.]|uniref:hypothetical protein n=1 Tax=Sutterella sp. TaxID=1981025 RepID=UPI0026DEAA6C|nr:hypothetical protein [Sutterella sp.]MDO5530744.1 hypothetical protein [Sutterella sp.]
MTPAAKKRITRALILFFVLSLIPLVSWLGWNPAAATISEWKKALDLWSGILLGGAMLALVASALRLPAVEKFMGGMPESYRFHRFLGIATAGLLAFHWWMPRKIVETVVALGFAEAPVRKAREAAEGFDFIGWLGHDVAWLGWLMFALIAVALFGKFIRQTRWVQIHRLFAPVALIGAAHGIAGVPDGFLMGLGWWATVAIALLTVAVVVLEFRMTNLRVSGKVLAEEMVTDADKSLTLSAALHRPVEPGEFVCLSLDKSEHPHPFTVASVDAPAADGTQTFTVIVRALGEYSTKIVREPVAGRTVVLEGPYGEFLRNPDATKPQVWVAGGIGVTPFLAMMKAAKALPGTRLVWSTRGSETKLAEMVRRAALESDVELTIIDSAKGQRLGKTHHLAQYTAGGAEVHCCGPEGLVKAAAEGLGKLGIRPLVEHFAWR